MLQLNIFVRITLIHATKSSSSASLSASDMLELVVAGGGGVGEEMAAIAQSDKVSEVAKL